MNAASIFNSKAYIPGVLIGAAAAGAAAYFLYGWIGGRIAAKKEIEDLEEEIRAIEAEEEAEEARWSAQWESEEDLEDDDDILEEARLALYDAESRADEARRKHEEAKRAISESQKKFVQDRGPFGLEFYQDIDHRVSRDEDQGIVWVIDGDVCTEVEMDAWDSAEPDEDGVRHVTDWVNGLIWHVSDNFVEYEDLNGARVSPDADKPPIPSYLDEEPEPEEDEDEEVPDDMAFISADDFLNGSPYAEHHTCMWFEEDMQMGEGDDLKPVDAVAMFGRTAMNRLRTLQGTLFVRKGDDVYELSYSDGSYLEALSELR